MEEQIWERALQDGTLKTAINTLIWIYGHPLMNLQEAEELATDFYTKLNTSCYGVENRRGKLTKSGEQD